MITSLGLEKLQQQLEELKSELNRTIEERKQAAAEGDLRENSAYLFLTERAEVLRTQIDQVNEDLKNAKVIGSPTQTSTIAFGHRVTVLFQNDNRKLTVTLVGKNDARLKPDWISCESPLGEALLGKRISQHVEVNGQSITILAIEVGDI